MKNLTVTAAALCLGITTGFAHDSGPAHTHDEAPSTQVLRFVVEKKGPVKAPDLLKEKVPVSGQGFWKFIAAKDAVPTPPETQPFLKGAHGTIIFDSKRDTVYWGLEKVGFVAFSNHLSQSWVVKGDAAFTAGGLHGADILQRAGKSPMVAVADNVKGEVYLTDTTFQHADRLDWPATEPYKDKKEYHPTDTAFINAKEMFVTDGYGKGFFMPVTTTPLKYKGSFFGGKSLSQTPHGITYDSSDKSMYISARPEGLIKKWSIAKEKIAAISALPPGNSVCDIDLWGHYALVPCLDGANKTPGPLFIVNLKTQSIVSTIRPKEDLGYADAQHMHDAAWYFHKKGGKTEVYIIFTNWNPGGIGALKLVNLPD